jgi:hypothetical protein
MWRGRASFSRLFYAGYALWFPAAAGRYLMFAEFLMDLFNNPVGYLLTCG